VLPAFYLPARSTFAESARTDVCDERGNKAPDCPEGARLIPLTRGFFAIVDEADYERFAAVRWRVQIGRDGERYAYRQERIAGTRRLRLRIMHREIVGALMGQLVDHEDGDGLNNRRKNLRVCTRAQNAQNRRLSPGRRFKGVHSTGKKARPFKAMIRADHRTHRLGRFATEIEAALAYDDAARRLHGEFARLNFPDGLKGACASHGLNIADGEATCLPGKNPT
jgi:hypothetical protein